MQHSKKQRMRSHSWPTGLVSLFLRISDKFAAVRQLSKTCIAHPAPPPLVDPILAPEEKSLRVLLPALDQWKRQRLQPYTKAAEKRKSSMGKRTSTIAAIHQGSGETEVINGQSSVDISPPPSSPAPPPSLVVILSDLASLTASGRSWW